MANMKVVLIALFLSGTAHAGICGFLRGVFFPKKLLSPHTVIKHPVLRGAWISHIAERVATYKITPMREGRLNKLLRIDSLIAGGEPRLSEQDAMHYVKALQESIKEAKAATPFGPTDTVGYAGDSLMESLKHIDSLEGEQKFAAIRTVEILFQLDRFHGDFSQDLLPQNLRSSDGENLNLRRLGWYYQFKSEASSLGN